jgi:hypothetical protein
MNKNIEKKYIKQYGLERSGTNYIRALIEENIEDVRVLSNLFGHKHKTYTSINYKNYNHKEDQEVKTELDDETLNFIKEQFINNQIYYLITVKEPYSWIVSYHKCYWIKENSGLLDHNKIIKYSNIWNETHKNWLENIIYQNKKFFIVMYEDMLINPNNIVNAISTKFKLKQKQKFVNINNYMKEGADWNYKKNIGTKSFNKKDYYLNKQYLNEINEFIDLIKKTIDHKLLNTIINETKKCY